MAHVLVTGAGGFIGLRLVRALVDRGEDVTCLAHRPGIKSKLSGLGVRAVTGDVRQLESLVPALDGIDVVYHLAGRVMAVSRGDFSEVNTLGAENIARACAAMAKPPVLVLVSSLAAAGPSERGRPRTVDEPPAPISLYGQSKYAGELAASRCAGDVPISIVRPPFVFGTGDSLSLPLFKMIRRQGLQIIVRGADLELTLTHVDDLATVLLAIADRGLRLDRNEVCGENGYLKRGVYYVGHPEVVRYSEMGKMIGDAYNRSVRVIRIGPILMWIGCAGTALYSKTVRRPSILNFDKLREARVAAWTCCVANTRNELNCSPQKSLAERIRQTAEWYQQEGLV